MSRESEGRAILLEVAYDVRNHLRGSVERWQAEFALNLAAVIEHMDPLTLMPAEETPKKASKARK